MNNFPISGKPIPEINLREISIGELQDLLDPRQPAKEANATIAKASGLSVEEVKALKVDDYRELVRAVFARSWNPLNEGDPKN